MLKIQKLLIKYSHLIAMNVSLGRKKEWKK